MNTVYATFKDRNLAERAVGALLDHGVPSEEISIVWPEPSVNDEAVDSEYHTKVVDRSSKHADETSAGSGLTTTTASDAASGAAQGAGVGLGVGVLAGIVAVAVPGFGLVLGGGALATALAGAAGATAAGAIAGGVTGYLKDQGMPQSAIQTYEEALGEGSAILAIGLTGATTSHTIEGILAKYGATNIVSIAPAIR